MIPDGLRKTDLIKYCYQPKIKEMKKEKRVLNTIVTFIYVLMT